jgi:hypothetical protein
VIIVPVGSSSVPAKSDHEVARVVPVGSESSCALVVLEVGKVAVVVLNIANGLTALKLVVELLLCRSSNRRSHGRAEKSEKSGSELHVVKADDDRRRAGWYDVCDGFKRSRSACSAPLLYQTARSDAHDSTRCYSA